jgi:hypothetical protein
MRKLLRPWYVWLGLVLLLGFACLPVRGSSHLGEEGNESTATDIDAMPKGARSRLGTFRMTHPGPVDFLAFSADGKELSA